MKKKSKKWRKQWQDVRKLVMNALPNMRNYLLNQNRGKHCQAIEYCTKLHNAGYKNCKDKVVLSKEELNTLIGNIEKSSEIKAEELEKACKETIKEIIDKVDDMIGGKMIAQALREIYLEVK